LESGLIFFLKQTIIYHANYKRYPTGNTSKVRKDASAYVDFSNDY
jgi:hypothetical protein